MSHRSELLPPHDPSDPALTHMAHVALREDEAAWRRCIFVGLRIQDAVLYEVRQCPRCPSVIRRVCRLCDAASALSGRLASLNVPLSLSQAAQCLADWVALSEHPQPSPLQTSGSNESPGSNEPTVVRIPLGTSLKDAERWIVLAALESCGGRRSEAARALGVSRRTLYNKLASIRKRSAS